MPTNEKQKARGNDEEDQSRCRLTLIVGPAGFAGVDDAGLVEDHDAAGVQSVGLPGGRVGLVGVASSRASELEGMPVASVRRRAVTAASAVP
jgi:hypothetical protein